jgi:TolA-binding protein
MHRLALLALFVLPGAAAAQSGVEGRLNELQRSAAALSAQIEQLRVQNQQLQQRLEKMQAGFEQRIERLEKRPAPAKPTPNTGRSKN